MTQRDMMRLALETGLHPNTVIRILKGDPRFRESTMIAIRGAASKLGIELPALPVESGKVRAT